MSAAFQPDMADGEIDGYKVGGTSPPPNGPAALLSVHETAAILNVSESWVRRHAHELPVVRVGRLVRFDRTLLGCNFSGKSSVGSRWNGKEPRSMNFQRRYQKGYVYKTGKKLKVWYGMYREDVRKLDGSLSRRQRNIRLGTMSELPTKFAAQEDLARRMQAIKAPSLQMTLTELVEAWEAVHLPTIKASTGSYYRRSLRSRILPLIGQREIASISKFDVESLLAEKAGVYARNTLREIRSSLSHVLGWAVEHNWIESNPCTGVQLPQGTGRQVRRRVLRADQVISLSGKLREPMATLVLLLATTGLRISEAIGIQWNDFEGDILHVQRRIYEGKADIPKTKGSRRDLPIPAPLLARIHALPKGTGLWVFGSKEGTAINPGNALKRYIRPAARELGIELGGWHDFRHTLTTALLRKGHSPETVAKILGHSDVSVTLNVYAHSDESDLRAPLNEVASQML